MTLQKALANNSLCLPFPHLLFSTTVVNNCGFLYLLLMLIIFRTYLSWQYKFLFTYQDSSCSSFNKDSKERKLFFQGICSTWCIK